ncbi:MAG: porin family protein [Deltaproteobacteria bacterium]|nr:porin family protein [Deltaproteobacteria bacterium]
MRIFGGLMAFCFALSLALPAQAQEGSFYLGLQGGGTYQRDIHEGIPSKIKADPGLAVGAVAGYTFKNIDRANIRVEAEVAQRYNAADEYQNYNMDGDITSAALMVNGAVDFVNRSRFTPYLLVGLGVAYISFNDVEADGVGLEIDDEDVVLAYQFGLGCAFKMTERLNIDLGYRYFATGDPKLRDNTGTDHRLNYENQALMVGVRFSF